MNRIYIVLTAFIGMVAAAAAIGQENYGQLFVLLEEPGGIALVDPQFPDRIDHVELEGDPYKLHPTPGGKFIFVSYRDTDQIDVIDFDDPFEPAHSFQVARTPDNIVFTPNGDTAYLSYKNRGNVVLYSHRKGEFSSQMSIPIGNTYSISFNRRATRLYQNGDDGLTFYLRKDYSEIAQVKRSEDAQIWTVGPNFRFIWGTGGSQLLIVDERRNRVTKNIRVGGGDRVAAHPVIFNDNVGYVLSENGKNITTFDTRRFRKQHEYSFSNAISAFTIDADGILWAVGDTQQLYRIRPIENEDDVQITTLELPGTAFAINYVELKSGENFACF